MHIRKVDGNETSQLDLLVILTIERREADRPDIVCFLSHPITYQKRFQMPLLRIARPMIQTTKSTQADALKQCSYGIGVDLHFTKPLTVGNDVIGACQAHQ